MQSKKKKSTPYQLRQNLSFQSTAPKFLQRLTAAETTVSDTIISKHDTGDSDNTNANLEATLKNSKKAGNDMSSHTTDDNKNDDRAGGGDGADTSDDYLEKDDEKPQVVVLDDGHPDGLLAKGNSDRQAQHGRVVNRSPPELLDASEDSKSSNDDGAINSKEREFDITKDRVIFSNKKRRVAVGNDSKAESKSGPSKVKKDSSGLDELGKKSKKKKAKTRTNKQLLSFNADDDGN
ncbi:hypothetical protein H4219_001909 [Mycoemilia scoparia]|uniref:DUF4604 domain-containing protein n=1 Tax=Mycoemilia scoparia TaxID=417184 RepID=A0A9W7ZZ56_9FUNG|nr:hypothetical protein H4219_001909 [Mycoemilia scoparia]